MRALKYSFLLLNMMLFSNPKPIQFSVPDCKILTSIPLKTKDCATIIPWYQKTYIYTQEDSYYKDYQRSYYAVTCKKGGWDCLRHYEILANGCIPYFYDLDLCPDENMIFFPKELVKEAMGLRGVGYNGYDVTIDHTVFEKEKYFTILGKLLQYTREKLTCKFIAQHLLNTIGYTYSKPILFLSENQLPEYMRCLMLVGLRQCLGANLIDVPKISHLYKSYNKNIANLYGKGMTYTKILDDIVLNREIIRRRIFVKEFEFIIYGSCHRGMPHYDLVQKIYPKENIILICGEDIHKCQHKNNPNLFLREFEESCRVLP